MDTVILVLEVIIAFFAMMFVHELGHFVFAKRAGILVREFSIGMGPKLFSFKKGETKYSLRILPLGAYVAMAGEDPEITDINAGQVLGFNTDSNGVINDLFVKKNNAAKIKIEEIDLEHDMYIKGYNEHEELVKYDVSRTAMLHYSNKSIQIAPWDRQFNSKSILNRFATIVAGPVFNMVFALLLFFTFIAIAGIPTSQVGISEIVSGSPAEQAGLQPGDVITHINGEEFDNSTNLIGKIQSSINVELDLTIQRDGNLIFVPVTPLDSEGTGKGLIGFRALEVFEKATFSQVISNGFLQFNKMIKLIFEGFEMLVTGDVGFDKLAGPVGIVKVTSDYAKAGIESLIRWTAVLSLYLGIFNLLPIPALDGSRLLFITIEAIRRKPIDRAKEGLIHFIGFAFLILLMIFVTVNDVSKLFS